MSLIGTKIPNDTFLARFKHWDYLHSPNPLEPSTKVFPLCEGVVVGVWVDNPNPLTLTLNQSQHM